MMKVKYFEDMDEFYKRARLLLEQKPVLYAQMLSIIHSIQQNPNSYGERLPYGLLVMDEHGQTMSAALRTAPYPLMVTEMSQEGSCSLGLEARGL